VFEGTEHDVRDFVASVRPDVDDLVVALAIRDNAFAILLLDGLDLLIRILQFRFFRLRNNRL
jgi:hypothetical protein